MKTEETDMIPYVGNHNLTWTNVREGSNVSLDAFWTFWFLYAICITDPERSHRAKEFVELAQRIANNCPKKWRGNVLRPNGWSYAPTPDHEKMVRFASNPTGLEFWITLILKSKHFGFIEAEIITKAHIIEGFKPNMLELHGGIGSKFTTKLKDALVHASPYAEALWITVTRNETAIVITPITKLPEQLNLPVLDTQFKGVRWIVIQRDGTTVEHLIPAYTGEIRYA